MGGLVLSGIGGGYTNPIATPVVDYDFKQGLPYGPALAFSRASAGYVDDASGNWTLVPAGTLRRSTKGALIEGQQTNSIRNNSMQGAAVGNPGTLPTNWASQDSLAPGITVRVVGLGTEAGTDYIDLRFSGTSTAAGNAVVWNADTSAVTASAGQLWTYSVFARVIAGAMPAPLNLFWVEVGGTNEVVSFGTLTSAAQRLVNSRVLKSGATAISAIVPFATVGSGAAVDVTLRIAWPQLEQWASGTTSVGGASSPIRTTGAAATRAADLVTGTLLQGLSGSSIAAVIRPALVAPGGVIARLGTTSDGVLLRTGASDPTRVEALSIVGGTAQASAISASGVLAVGTRTAVAASFTAGKTAISVNGASVVSAAPASFPSGMLSVAIGGGTVPFNGYEERVAFLPAAMVDAEIQRLATLSTWGG